MTTNDFDPTTNRIPFGLLSEDEQSALMDWPHGFEFWWEDEWNSCAPAWQADTVYRGKPAPVVTSVWSNVHPKHVTPYTYGSRAAADRVSSSPNCTRIAVLRIDTCNGVSTAHLEQLVATKEGV